MNTKINSNKSSLPHFSNIVNQLDNSDGDIIIRREPSTFDTVIGCIEDILIDDNFSNMQKNFLEKYWQTFENSEENKLCYMDIFQEYTNMIEIFIENELNKKIPNFFMQSFIQELIERKNDLDGEVFEMLFTLTDFIAFKQMILDYKAVDERGANRRSTLRIEHLFCKILKSWSSEYTTISQSS
nr:PREDICTED: ADP-ribosylation factor-like protein 2-binding protein isoform X2 [Bemisia tabaci]